MSLRHASAMLALTLAATPAGAQTPPAPPAPAPAVTLSATLETFYEWNANRPPDRVNALRAYDTRANTFGLQQAALVIERAADPAAGRRAGLRVDLQFGQATETVQGNAANEPRPDAYRQVWQAYGTYVLPWHDVRIDAGKFASNLGYETNYAKDNAQFSRAFLFNALPFYHSGLRVSVPAGPRLTLMYMLTNGIQQTEEFNGFKSHHVTAVVTPAASLSWTTSYFAGREQPDGGLGHGPDGAFTVLDSYASWSPVPAVSLGVDVNHVRSAVHRDDTPGTLTGLGVYARGQARDGRAAAAARYERLRDDSGLFGGVSQTLQEVTVTLERTLADGLIARAEYRHDWSSQAVFPGAEAGARRSRQPTVLVGAIWSFGDKTGVW